MKSFLVTFSMVISVSVAGMGYNYDSYDSTRNYLGLDFRSYAGQTLIFCPLTDSTVDFKYFGLNPELQLCVPSNIYKPNLDSSGSELDSLRNRKFHVVGVKSKPDVWLVLVDYLNDTCYFRYHTYSYSKFPFVVEGYYSKMKRLYEGQSFYARRISIGYSDSLIDFTDGHKFQLTPGDKYICEKVFLSSFGVKFLLANSKNSFAVFAGMEDMEYFLMTLDRAREIENKYGERHAKEIVRGNVVRGMSQQEVKLSLGDPREVTIQKRNKYQWLYLKRDRTIEVDFKRQKVRRVRILKTK